MDAEPGHQTVLVTGGSGYVGGWMIVALLQRGYRVRTTLRDLAREGAVRAAVASQVDRADRLSCCAADLSGERGAGVRLRPTRGLTDGARDAQRH